MKIRCDYCNNHIKDTDEKCPYCGSINAHLVRAGKGTPQTIEELQSFCAEKKLPLEKMRFFIGKDCKSARAFGIYKDSDDNFVVYKNKSDGSRVVRYQGKDEAYAVNEIYMKLRNEVVDRKESGKITPANQNTRTRSSSTSRNTSSSKKKRNNHRIFKSKTDRDVAIFWIVILIIGILLVRSCIRVFDETPNAGYYKYSGAEYYNDYSRWYEYDDEQDLWLNVDCPAELHDTYKEHYIAPPNDADKDIPEDVRGTYKIFDKKNTDTYSYGSSSGSSGGSSSYSYSSGGSNYYDDDDDSYSSWYDYDWGSSWDDDDDWGSSWDDDWDSGWDDNDWDYDYSGWDDWDSDWDSDW